MWLAKLLLSLKIWAKKAAVFASIETFMPILIFAIKTVAFHCGPL
jgi:hypothetical protein